MGSPDMAAKMTLSLFLVLYVTTTVIGQLVLVNEPLEVAIGRNVVLDERVLAIQSPEEDEQCKVEVAVDEPFYQRVGILEPQVFDCEFFPGSIRYVHSGSPLLDHDIIKLRVYMLTGTDSIIETFYLHVNVTQEEYRVIRPMMYIEVDEFNGISDPIDMRILDFAFNRSSPSSSCFVRINTLTSGLPRYGELIQGEGEETREVKALYENCDDFLYLNIRYLHILPPSPNADYIELTIEVEDPGKYDRPFVERFQLMVNIDPAFENQNPTEAFLAQYIMDVDQFILTTITTDVMSGTDDETSANELVFYISKPPGPGEGSIVHLDDQSRPIESFSQADLLRYNIAYKPPDRSYPDVRLIEIEFEVYDEYFAKSEPITLTVAVHPTQTNAPRVSINRGLTLLEGQSRPIHPQNFEVVDNDNINMVRIKVVGGPHHGRLLLNNRPMIMFTPHDIEAGSVVYRHDDSDTLKDSIELRISDMSQTVHTSFPINILPSDDSPPSLIRNIQIEVNEGQTVRITRFALLASDKDSNDNYIVYRITNPPVAGEILKKYSADSFGYPVTDFTQRDLFRGMIYYHHLGREEFMDSFDIVLLDNHIPPNVSPTQMVLVTISPVHDLPPEIFSGVTSAITVKETDIGYITREHLRYTDTESDDEELRYTITTPPYVIATHSLTDAGRIFSTIGVVMPMKDPTIQGVRTFQQRDIDHHTIAYMPPFKEIGPNPREIRFVYSVSDKYGNLVLGHFFDITVLPVNNQAPVIFTNNLMVPEGGILIIQAMHFTITDMDTDTSDLVITLDSPPEYGQLVVGNVNLTEGGTFSVGDINAGRVRYIHGGSEVPKDDFTVSVSDGVHSATRDVIVSVTPVNDQIPVILPGLITQLTIAEGGEIAITPDIIAATDVDTNDMLLHFIIVQHPKRGVVLRNGIIVNRFTQLDVKQGSISYVHMGGETGKVSVLDSVTFVVSDKSIPSAANLPVHEINITITPVDNQAPGIVFGNPFLVNEGDKAPLTLAVLSAIDRDSNLDQLTFHIVGQPSWGLVENILPSPGYEKSNAGKPIIFFTYQDIIDGNINYVQTIHSQVEPMSDSFILYVSDGKHLSPNVSFIVNIIPVNDETPTLTVSNFSVFENSFFKLNTNYIIASDLDIPMEMLMFSVIKSPQHGSLVDWALPVESRLPIFDFNLNQLLNTLRLTYVHDGSESTSDDFAIRVTDGKHTVQKSIYVTIIPVNDEPPEIIKNTGVTVDIHESRVISPVLLLARDKDTPADELYYTIVTLPKRGVLQRKLSADTWIDITVLNSNFTQEELNLNIIRYLHSSDLGSKGLDRFRFVVTDGVHSTGKESFRIDITNTKREPLQLINTGAEVFEGEFVIIAPECLAAFDNGNNLAEIFFTINVPPSEGQIEDLSRPGIPISSFSQLNIVGQRVIYVHKRTDRIRNDNFMFSVTNGYQTRNDTFHIVVIPVDNELPALIINEPLEIPEGGSDFIKPSHLEAIDQDTPPQGVTFIILQPPQYGTLYLGGLPIIDRFTQFDLNNYDISYNQLIPGAERDGFYFVVTDNTNIGFTIKNSPQSQPVKFTINIDHMDSQPPRLITNIIPIKMENRNRRYGFIFSQQVLYSEDECPPEGITYMITREPVHGHLENLAKRQRVQGQFTQQEVNDRSIMYIMKEETKVTNDSFLFSVYDCNGNALMGQKFELKWPMIQFMRADYMVCETVGILQINIMRVGYLSLSSFVDIEVSDLTATTGADYAPPRSRQLQFDPGVAMATWDVEIIEDELEENRERFRLKLGTSVNAILGEHEKLTVIIKDSKDGTCQGENHGMTITDTLPSCCLEGVIQPNPRPLCCPDQGPIYPDVPHLGPIIPRRNPPVPGEDTFNPVYPVKPGDGIPPGQQGVYPDVPGPYPVPEGYVPQGGPYEGGFVPGNPDQGYVYPGDPRFIPDGECCPPDHVPGQGETGYPYPQQPDQGHGLPQQPKTQFDQQGRDIYPQDAGVYPQDPYANPQDPRVYPQDAGVYTQNQQGQGVVPNQQYPSTPNWQWNPYYGGQPHSDPTTGGGTASGTNPGGIHPSQTGSQGHPVWPYYTKDGQPYIPDQFGNPTPATDSQGRPHYQEGQGPISQGSDGGVPYQGDSHAVPQYPTHQGQNPQFQSSWSTHQGGNPQYPGVPVPAQNPYQNPGGGNPQYPGVPVPAQNPYQNPGGGNPQYPGVPAQNPYQNPGGGNPQFQGGIADNPQPGPNSRGRTHYSGHDPNPNPGTRPVVPGRVSNGQHILSRPSGKNGSTTTWTLHGIASSPIVVHGRTSSSSSSSSSSSHHQPLPSTSQGVPVIPPEQLDDSHEPVVNPDQWQVSTAEHRGKVTSESTQPVETPSECTTTSKDDFIMAEDTGTLYKCDGNRWIRVEWSHVQADDATNQDTGCGEGWLELDGMCYFISTEAETWNNAQRSCRERYHGNLVTISSSKIYNWIRSVAERRELWIGLNDKHTIDQWEWVSGAPVTFTRWKVGSPMPGNHSDRNCASYNNHARWNEKKCSKNKHLYMCEKRL